jgi:hypothetical protein
MSLVFYFSWGTLLKLKASLADATAIPVALGNRLDRESQLIGVIAKAVGRGCGENRCLSGKCFGS